MKQDLAGFHQLAEHFQIVRFGVHPDELLGSGNPAQNPASILQHHFQAVNSVDADYLFAAEGPRRMSDQLTEPASQRFAVLVAPALAARKP